MAFLLHVAIVKDDDYRALSAYLDGVSALLRQADARVCHRFETLATGVGGPLTTLFMIIEMTCDGQSPQLLRQMRAASQAAVKMRTLVDFSTSRVEGAQAAA